MIIQYFESLLGPYANVVGATGLDSINFIWLSFAILLIVSFHCVMLLLTALLRKVVSK